MKKLVVVIVLEAVVAAGVYFYPRFFEKPKENGALRLSGNIEAHESLVGFKVVGRIVALPVEEGQQVETGQILAQLEDRDLAQQVALEEATVQVRTANLALAEAGSRKEDIAAARESVRETEVDLAQRKLDLERAERLYARDVVSAEQRDQARTAVKRSEAVVARAREQLRKAEEGARPEEISIARRNVQQAQESVGLAKVRLGFTTLRAPKAGIITVRQAELGEVVSAGTPVVTLADLDDVWLRAYIAETDLGKVKYGQQVSVRTDTYPGKVYRGRVTFISSKAEFTPKSVETHKERVTLVYRIKIAVENANQELKPGMPADAVIEVEKP